MAKKSDGSGGRLLVTAASAGVVFVIRKVLAAGWTRVTGKEPPTDLTDPKVTLVEALGWAVLVGVTAETARFAVARATARKALPESGDGK
jgi:hypothetical protein